MVEPGWKVNVHLENMHREAEQRVSWEAHAIHSEIVKAFMMLQGRPLSELPHGAMESINNHAMNLHTYLSVLRIIYPGQRAVPSPSALLAHDVYQQAREAAEAVDVLDTALQNFLWATRQPPSPARDKALGGAVKSAVNAYRIFEQAWENVKASVQGSAR